MSQFKEDRQRYQDQLFGDAFVGHTRILMKQEKALKKEANLCWYNSWQMRLHRWLTKKLVTRPPFPELWEEQRENDPNINS